MKRSGKFYSKNEKETLKSLGLTPAPQSGAGWVIKEDGENDNFIVQLKSTDASSYRIDMLDIKKLEYHASVSNKTPIFIVQFLSQNKMYAIVSIDDLAEVCDGLKKNNNEYRKNRSISFEHYENVERKEVKSSSKARNKFFEEKELYYDKQKRRFN